MPSPLNNSDDICYCNLNENCVKTSHGYADHIFQQMFLFGVTWCYLVEQLTLFRVTHFLVSVENLKRFCLGCHILLFCFSFSLWTLRFLLRPR